jgi:hypothetical protein
MTRSSAPAEGEATIKEQTAAPRGWGPYSISLLSFSLRSRWPKGICCVRRAKINPAISFHVLRHTHGSTLAMRGVPMGVIAEQLGHADTRMTAKHYAHLAPSYVADTIRANFWGLPGTLPWFQ